VYLHGLIRDGDGAKMSKSKGNVIDPLGLMDEMGTDALRFTLLVGSTPGNDMNLSTKKVEANRNFANKIWNAGRFVLGTLDSAPAQALAAPDWTLADSWIWARLQTLEREADRLFTGFQYGEAGRQIYEFFWSEFSDWYLEIAKLQMAEGGDRAFYTAQTLARVLDAALRLLHPFTPFVTEELWGHLKRACQAKPELYQPQEGWAEMLIVAKWPEAQGLEGWEAKKVTDFSLLQEIIREVRNLRTEKKVTPGRRIAATILAGDRLAMLQSQAKALAALAYIDPLQLTLVESLPEKPQDQAGLVVSGIEIYLPLSGLVDLESEQIRLQKELDEVQSQVARLEGLLGSPFAQKAPAAVVDKERQKLAGYQETAASLREQLQAMK
jgi:valyl-tRNA synthetase